MEQTEAGRTRIPLTPAHLEALKERKPTLPLYFQRLKEQLKAAEVRAFRQTDRSAISERLLKKEAPDSHSRELLKELLYRNQRYQEDLTLFYQTLSGGGEIMITPKLYSPERAIIDGFGFQI